MTIKEDAASLGLYDTLRASPPESRPEIHDIPDEPLVTIRPGRSWSGFSIPDLWGHRELLYFLTLRDLRVRYKQTMLGAIWIVMQPLLMTVIFTVFLGFVARVSTPGIPYPVYVYSGLLPWMFISGGIAGCSTSLTGNSNLLTKVYFPRVLLPAAYLGTRVVDFAISFAILGGVIATYRFAFHFQVNFTWKLSLLLPIMFLMTVFTFSIGTLVASLNVKYRDVGVALPVLIQLWMFTSPIIYPVSMVPERWRTLYSVNPLVGLIQGFRGALLGAEIPGLALTFCAGETIIILILAAFVFRQTEKGFADIV